MALFLSHHDVARLLEEPSALNRADMAVKLAKNLGSPQLTQSELAIAQDIVRIMARDVEEMVRRALAESLRRATKLPHDVALRLAMDVDAVALPILSESPILTDDDLVQIIRGGSPVKQTIIARRADLSELVSEEIVAHGEEVAVAALMRNATARISESTLGRAVDRFPHSEAVTEGMARRQYLPPAIAERLIATVSDKLKQYLVSHHELPLSLATDVVTQTREMATIRMSYGARAQDLEAMVAQMHRNKRLTPSLLLRVLCLGDVAFFEVAMAQLARVPVANARILIHDAGPRGLQSIYDKAGLPPQLLPVIRVALDVVHETDFDGGANDLERYRARVISRVLTQIDDFKQDDLDYLLAKLGDVLHLAA
jgi:uncharacterized protein (DUF2336 family)